MTTGRDAVWPALPNEEWKDTYATLHMWSQIVGKIAVALAPPINHSWGVSLGVPGRGFAPGPAAFPSGSFPKEFDFGGPEPVVQAAGRERRALKLEPRTGAYTYGAIMAMLSDLALPVK